MLLAAFAVTAIWLLSLLVKPFGRCWRCLGKGNLRSRRRKRAPACPVCKGLKRRQRLGSHTVHRVRRQVAAHWRGPR